MFALIDKEDYVVHFQKERYNPIPHEMRMVEYSDDIENPLFIQGVIVENYPDFIRKNIIKEKIIKEGVSWITKLSDMQGINFTEEEFEEMKNKVMFPKGYGEVFKEVLFMQATGNFSAGQEVGSRIMEIEQSFENKKHFIIEPEIEVTLDL